MPDQWTIGYKYKQMSLNFRLGLTAFGHIGVFPEQAVNWNYVYDLVTQNAKRKTQKSKPELNQRIRPASRVPRHLMMRPASRVPRPVFSTSSPIPVELP